MEFEVDANVLCKLCEWARARRGDRGRPSAIDNNYIFWWQPVVG